MGITPARRPACFLYSLEARVRPRVEFLQQRGVPIPGRHEFLALPDRDFCRRIARCELAVYLAFLASRGASLEGQAVGAAELPQHAEQDMEHDGALSAAFVPHAGE